jgi:transposase
MTPTCTPTLTKWISIRAVDAGWVRRQRETGSIAPGKMGGHRIWVLERIKAGDFTLRGLVAELALKEALDLPAIWSRNSGATR